MGESLVIENYIKVITTLRLNEKIDTIRSTDIATRLNISAAAVSDRLKKLKKKGLITSFGHQGIELTDKGLQMGKKMIRHHRLWETFLHQVLQVPLSDIHNEAEKLEHASSEKLINAIDAYLHYPKTDPHGNPIPDKAGELSFKETDFPLSEAQFEKIYYVNRFVSMDADYLDYLSKLGVRLGTQLILEKKLNFDDSLLCRIKGKRHTLSQKCASCIFVEQV